MVALWSEVPVVVSSEQIGLSFSIIFVSQKLIQFATVLCGMLVTKSFGREHTSMDITRTSSADQPESTANGIDVIFLSMSVLAVCSAVWAIYIDESGNGTKASARPKSLIPFSPQSGRRRAVYVPGALRRVTEGTSLATLLDYDEEPTPGCSSPDIEVEINTMINRTSGKWEPNPHYLAFKTVSKGRRALEKELMSGRKYRDMSEDHKQLDESRARSYSPSCRSDMHNGDEDLERGQRAVHSDLGGTLTATPPWRVPESAGSSGHGGAIVPPFSLWGKSPARSDCLPPSPGRLRKALAMGAGGKAEPCYDSERTPLLSASPYPTYTETQRHGQVGTTGCSSSLPIPSSHAPVACHGAWYGDDGEGGVGDYAEALLETGAANSLPSQTTIDRLTKGVKFAGDVHLFPERRVGDGQHPRIHMKRRTRSAEDFPIRYYT